MGERIAGIKSSLGLEIPEAEHQKPQWGDESHRKEEGPNRQGPRTVVSGFVVFRKRTQFLRFA